MARLLLATAVAALTSSPAWAVEYHCPVSRKVVSEIVYTQEQLDRWGFAVKITDLGDTAVLSRCGFSPTHKKNVCDEYEVEHTASSQVAQFDDNDKFIGFARIRKFYDFRSQFDVQLYPNLHFVENNGRGTVAYGKCSVVSP